MVFPDGQWNSPPWPQPKSPAAGPLLISKQALIDAGFQPAYFPIVNNAVEIIFAVEPCAATGGYVARWDAPGGGGITTQGDSFAELDVMIGDAVSGYFEPDQRPKSVRLHFSQDPILN
jgi:hypothetical protein